MQIVRMHCPACGAPLTVATDEPATVCSFCRTQLAVMRGAGQPALRPTSLPVAPVIPPHSAPLAGSQPARAVEISNLRGCLVALFMWFFGGPLLVLMIFAPIALLLPSDDAGQVLMPDAIAACIGLLFFLLPLGLGLYAFVYFRRRENGVWGFIANPLRAGVRRLRR